MSLTSGALLAGEGSFFANIDDLFGTDEGLDSDGPFPCLAPGCYIGASFNLVNITYQQVGDQAVTGVISSFANVEGEFLYSQERGFPGFDDYTPSEAFSEDSRLFVGTPVPLPVLGDCNLDGNVDFSDIPSMIEILIDGSYLPQADCDEDGFVNFQDIEPFVAILING